MTRAQNLAVVVTCFVAAMTYAGAVTMDGMGLFVLPGVAGAALVGSFLAARRMPAMALIVGGLLVLGWAELVNFWSGTGAGPAARSTAIAAASTVVALVAARSDSPALLLLPIAASICGALLLGAGSEVRSVAVAAVVSGALTLGWIERSRRHWTAPRRGASLVLLSLLAGAVAAGVVLLQVQHDVKPPEALASGQAYPHIKPPWRDPLGTAPKFHGSPPPAPVREASPPSPPANQQENPPHHLRHSPPPQQHQPPQPHRAHPPAAKKPPTATRTHAPRQKHVAHRKHASPSRIWRYVLAGILLIALAVAARLLAVRIAWRRLRRRLATGAPADQIVGAWTWARIRLDAFRLPLPVAASPDVVAAGGASMELPAEVFAPLQTLAASTTTAAFANEQSVGSDEVNTAWADASRAEVSARELLTRRARIGLAFRSPAPITGTP
jgi:hypothetical protein